MLKKTNPYDKEDYRNLESAILFDGVDDGVSFPGGSVGKRGEISVSCLINVRSASSTSGLGSTVVGKWDGSGGSTDNSFVLYMPDQTTDIGFAISDGGGPDGTADYLTTGTYTLNLDTWYHVFGVFGNGRIRLYVDSILVDEVSTAKSAVHPSGRDIDIAYRPSESRFSNIAVAQCTIYETALTQLQIENIVFLKGQLLPGTADKASFHCPLQTENIYQDSRFTEYSQSATTDINQAGHGLSVGEWIYDNAGTWEEADSAVEAKYSDPPRLVVAVADVNNFTYAEEGLYPLPSHGQGALGSYVYVDNDGSGNPTHVQKGNAVAKVITDGLIQIAGTLSIKATAATRQFGVGRQGFAMETNSLLFWTDQSAGATASVSSNLSYIEFNNEDDTSRIEYSGPNFFTPEAGRDYSIRLDAEEVLGNASTDIRVSLGGASQDAGLTASTRSILDFSITASNGDPLSIELLGDLSGAKEARIYWLHANASDVPFQDGHGEIVGKSASDIRHILDDSSRDRTNYSYYKDRRFTGNGKSYKGSNSYDTIPSVASGIISAGNPFSLLVAIDPSGFAAQQQVMQLGSTDVDDFSLSYGSDTLYVSFGEDASNRIAVEVASISGYLHTGRKNTIHVLWDGVDAAGLSVYMNGTEVPTSVTSDTLGAGYSSATTMRVAARDGSADFLDATVYALDILDRVATAEEVRGSSESGTFIDYATVALPDFLISLNFDKLLSDRQGLTTFDGTPQYSSLSSQQPPFIEARSGYPPIRESLRILNIEAGNPDGDNNYVSMDRGNLPGISDDFTIFWTGRMPSLPVRVSANTSGKENIFNGLVTMSNSYLGVLSDRRGIRLEYAYEDKSAGSLIAGVGSIRAVHIGGGGVTDSIQVPINGLLDFAQCSFAISVSGSTMHFYINGALAGESSVTRGDFSAVDYFDIGVGNGMDGTKTSDNTILSNSYFSSFGYWKKALSKEEVSHLHGEGNFNNPWDFLPLNYRIDMKRSIVIWHQGAVGSIYDDGTDVRLSNLADPSGATDGVLEGFSGATLNDRRLKAIENVHLLS